MVAQGDINDLEFNHNWPQRQINKRQIVMFAKVQIFF